MTGGVGEGSVATGRSTRDTDVTDISAYIDSLEMTLDDDASAAYLVTVKLMIRLATLLLRVAKRIAANERRIEQLNAEFWGVRRGDYPTNPF